MESPGATPDSVRITRLRVQDWKQFEDVDLTFHPRLTVITGGNGAGKSTMLRMIGAHMGWSSQEIATPTWRTAKEYGRYLHGFMRRLARGWNREAPRVSVAELEYSNGARGELQADVGSDNPQFALRPTARQKVPGIYLPSHRPEFGYVAVGNLPASPPSPLEAHNSVRTALHSMAQGHEGTLTGFQSLKQTLVGWELHSRPSERARGTEEIARYFDGFEQVLRLVLPADIGFKRLVAAGAGEIIMDTNSGEFPIDAASGGIAALIVIAWELYTFQLAHEGAFTVVIDEPENHLHPKMQRDLLGTLLEAFPTACFIIATHSPLIISSVRDKGLYALDFNEDRSVSSISLDDEDAGKDASEVLERVLGLESAFPAWVDDALKQALAEAWQSPSPKAALVQLRQNLAEVGLGDLVPEAGLKYLDGRRQQ